MALKLGIRMGSLLVVWLGALTCVSACGGRRLMQLCPTPAPVEFNYDKNGTDWPGLCQTGNEQSPINVDSTDTLELHQDNLYRARFLDFGKVSGVQVFDTGHGIEVGWQDWVFTPKIEIPVVDNQIVAGTPLGDPGAILATFEAKSFIAVSRDTVHPVPQQFHFHVTSENSIDGKIFAMEMHLVSIVPQSELASCPCGGCIIVLAVVFEQGNEDNEFLKDLFDSIPDAVGEENANKLSPSFTADLNDLIPTSQSYYTWEGSLTTPPCTQGVTWILFDTPQTVSKDQLQQLQSKMGGGSKCDVGSSETSGSKCEHNNNRPVQPLNGRTVVHASPLQR